MKLSTGKVAFPLEFDNGDVVNIMINPHEKGLRERIKNFESSLKSRLEKVNFEKNKDLFNEDVDVSNLDFASLIDMSAEDLEKLSKRADVVSAIDEELEKQFCDEIDSIFDSDVSSKAFKYVPPLAMVLDENGEAEIYIVLVLKALALEIQKYGNKTNDAANKYVSKYPKNR